MHQIDSEAGPEAAARRFSPSCTTVALSTWDDLHFARRFQAFAGITSTPVMTTTLQLTMLLLPHTQCLHRSSFNRSFAHRSGMPDCQIGLGHSCARKAHRFTFFRAIETSL